MQLLYMSYHRQYQYDKILIPDLKTLKSRIQNLKIENIKYDYKLFNNFKSFIKKILENEYIHRSPNNILKCKDLIDKWLNYEEGNIIKDKLKEKIDKPLTIKRFLKHCNDNMFKILPEGIENSQAYIEKLLNLNEIERTLLEMLKNICKMMVENKKKCIRTNSNYMSTSEIFNSILCGLSLENINTAIDFFLNSQTTLVENLEKNITNNLGIYKNKIIDKLSDPKYELTIPEKVTCFLLCEDTTNPKFIRYKNNIRHLINDNLIYIETVKNFIKLNSFEFNLSIIIEKRKILLKDAICSCLL